jgi:hypothetical protein
MKKVNVYEAIINEDIRRDVLEIEKNAILPPAPPGVPADMAADVMTRMMIGCVAAMKKGMLAKWN